MAGVYASSLKRKAARLRALYHLINHGTYPRGAIGHALDLAGAARPVDAYTVFVYAAEPGRRMVWRWAVIVVDFVIQRYYFNKVRTSDIGDRFRKTGYTSGFLRNVNL